VIPLSLAAGFACPVLLAQFAVVISSQILEPAVSARVMPNELLTGVVAMETDLAYWNRRADEEDERALAATAPELQSFHRKCAALYRERTKLQEAEGPAAVQALIRSRLLR